MTAFKPGQTYECRSICDYDCRWTFKVTGRTAQFVTLRCDDDKVYRVKVRPYGGDTGVEACSPFGSYSLAPVLHADWTT